MVTDTHRVAECLEVECLLGNRLAAVVVGDGAQPEHEVIERHLVHTVVEGDLHAAVLQVDARHPSAHDDGVPQAGTQRSGNGGRLQPTGCHVRQEGRKDHGIVVADQRDDDRAVVPKYPLQVLGGRNATEASADDHDARASLGDRGTAREQPGALRVA